MEKNGSVETMHQTSDNLGLDDLGRVVVVEHSEVPWYKQTGLRKLYFMMPIMFLGATTNGYDGSLLNGLQTMDPWQECMSTSLGQCSYVRWHIRYPSRCSHQSSGDEEHSLTVISIRFQLSHRLSTRSVLCHHECWRRLFNSGGPTAQRLNRPAPHYCYGRVGYHYRDSHSSSPWCHLRSIW